MNFRLLQKPPKRPDSVETFELLAKLDLWNGNSNGIHENSSQHSDLKSRLSRITDELNQLKMERASECSKSSSKDITDIEYNDTAISMKQSMSESISNSIKSTSIVEKSMSFESSGFDVEEHEDKDTQIRILSNKLIEKDKQTSEMQKEIDRLRDIIEQRKG